MTATDVYDGHGPGGGEQNVLSVYSRSQRRYVGLAVWDPAAAAMGVDFFRDGHAGYLPAGVSYHSHSSTPFSGPGWTAQWQGYINYAWADSWEKDKWDEPTSTLTARNNGGFVPDGTEDKEAAEIVAQGVEAGLQVLTNGCWNPGVWNRNVRPGNRYFANVQNPDKFIKGWNDAYSMHNKGAKESPSIFDFGIHPTSDIERAFLPPNIEAGNFSLVIKYYPSEGMAVTANTDSLDHLYGAVGFASGLDPDVNVRYAQQLLDHVPKCKK